jgi:cell division protein FtsQ
MKRPGGVVGGQQFAQRANAVRRAALVRTAKIVAAVAALAALVFVVFFSPVFAVRAGDIEVSGVGGAAKANEIGEVLQTAVGEPLATLSTGDLRSRLERLPGVRQASVSRDWPTGLRVNITPRAAAAAVPAGSTYAVLAADAVVVDKVDTPPEGLPVINVPLTQGNERIVKGVLDVIGSLPKDLAAQVSAVEAGTQDTVTLHLASGPTVLWGDSSQASLKAAVVTQLLAAGPASSIDVSAPEFPVVR